MQDQSGRDGSLLLQKSHDHHIDSGSDSDSSLPARLRPLVFWSRSVFVCSWPGCHQTDFKPTKDPMIALKHLQQVHSIHIHQVPHVMPFLDEYIHYWAHQVDSHGISILDSFKVGANYYLGRSDPTVYNTSSGINHQDSIIRARFRQTTLEAVLRVQEQERALDAHHQRQCLFCKLDLPTRADLFSHMFCEHGFNIGLPDNLVHVNEFLDTLHRHLTALECIYCERTFKSNIILRKHMRKKKHFKINPKNQFYDRYYLINYAEPDAIAHRDEEESLEQDDWEDWNEDDAEEPTMCLFEETVLPSVEGAHEHMISQHGFDLRKLARQHHLSFHDVIRLINYIRSQTCKYACFTCCKAFETASQLDLHFTQICQYQFPKRTMLFWTDPRFLVPFYDNDPLLTLDVLDDDMYQNDSNVHATVQMRSELSEHAPSLIEESAIKDSNINN
ncbi:hypothetical protein O5D80_002974 [Batrachochytrium dendrobatidis]|nr:hypothetical protein O5D80_002974 [Batrachochytrium dendrobatidis]